MVTTQDRMHMDDGSSGEQPDARPGLGAALLAFGVFMLIALGSYTVWQRMGGESAARAHGAPDTVVLFPGQSRTVKDAAGKIEMAAFLHNETYVSRASDFRRAEVVAIMGHSTLDLSDAELTASRGTIEAVALLGGVDIKVPPDWTVKTKDFVALGALHNDAKQKAGDTAAGAREPGGQGTDISEKIVDLEAVAMLGAIRVTH